MEKDKQALIDILNATKQIISYSKNIKKEELQQNDEKQAAILYKIGKKTWFLAPHRPSQKPGFCHNLCVLTQIWERNPVSRPHRPVFDFLIVGIDYNYFMP